MVIFIFILIYFLVGAVLSFLMTMLFENQVKDKSVPDDLEKILKEGLGKHNFFLIKVSLLMAALWPYYLFLFLKGIASSSSL